MINPPKLSNLEIMQILHAHIDGSRNNAHIASTGMRLRIRAHPRLPTCHIIKRNGKLVMHQKSQL